MRTTSVIIGFIGLVATVASWVSEPAPLTLEMISLLLLCLLGGFLPLRLPGLHPLPFSLPIVGAIAVTSSAAEAMVGGLLAGLATALSPRLRFEDQAEPSSRWSSALTVGGALAMAAGLVANGFSRLGLRSMQAPVPSAPSPIEMTQMLGLLAAAFFFSWLAARMGSRHDADAWRSALRGLLAASAIAMISIGLTAASRVLGWRPLMLILASAGITTLLFSWRLHRDQEDLDEARLRAASSLDLVEALALAIEAKDRTSERHLLRMRVICVEIGRRLGIKGAELESLEYAALLHDIGKLVVPESILSKPAGLSSEEFQTMSEHARIGAEILETTALPGGVAAMVRHHHERYDGSGYPAGLVGVEIPQGARILAAADTFEALTSSRPYRRSLPVSDAVAYLQRNAGTLFDPRVVSILVQHHTEFEKLVEAEEKNRNRTSASGFDTLKITPPLQVVLDRIASSHMEVYSIHDIRQALGKTLDLEESFTLIAGKVKKLIHYSSCAIYIVDPASERLQARYATGAGAASILGLSIPLGEKLSGWSALQGLPCLSGALGRDTDGMETYQARSDLEDAAPDPELRNLTSSVVAPLTIGETTIGVLALYDDAANEYTPQEEHLLALIAKQVASAVRTGLLFEQTQELALTDSLTGLPNSRYMFMVFDQESTRASQEGTPLSLLVMNLDGFRTINDDFGHHAGDRFLVGMAKAIRSQMRICDTCIRYSGDEFVAILPRLDASETGALIERLHDAATDYCMETRPGHPVRLSLSVGHATMPADGSDFESLMAVAVARMQEQKQQRHQIPFGAMARIKEN